MTNAASVPSRATKLLYIIFFAGLILQLFLFFRAWLSNDQVILLQVGLDYAGSHHWPAVAKGMSGAGHVPGSLLALLIGLPLEIFPHFKAPNIVVFLFHVIAVLLLINVLSKSIGLKFTVIFLGLYWLSPWRLYHAGFLWEPSFLYLPAAVHLWACWRLKDRRTFGPSLVLGLILIATFQIHASFVILLVLTLMLIARRLVKLNWLGLACGCVIGGITLVPTIMALVEGTLPSIPPQDGFPGRGLVYVFPLLKSLLYWVRFISLDAGGIIKSTVFFKSAWTSLGPTHEFWGFTVKSLYAIAVASVVFCGAAALLYLKKAWAERAAAGKQAEQWIGQYVLMALLAMFVSAGLSPVTVQGWHVILILPAACISGAYWMYRKMDSGKNIYRWIIIAVIVLRVPLAVAIGYGHPRYRVTPLTESISPELVTEELLEILPGAQTTASDE
ncbi:hypothetical protein ACFLQW_00820 [Candidatus Zixiibacteriota bacterium]